MATERGKMAALEARVRTLEALLLKAGVEAPPAEGAAGAGESMLGVAVAAFSGFLGLGGGGSPKAAGVGSPKAAAAAGTDGASVVPQSASRAAVGKGDPAAMVVAAQAAAQAASGGGAPAAVGDTLQALPRAAAGGGAVVGGGAPAAMGDTSQQAALQAAGRGDAPSAALAALAVPPPGAHAGKAASMSLLVGAGAATSAVFARAERTPTPLRSGGPAPPAALPGLATTPSHPAAPAPRSQNVPSAPPSPSGHHPVPQPLSAAASPVAGGGAPPPAPSPGCEMVDDDDL
jgi:hypothetical protein